MSMPTITLISPSKTTLISHPPPEIRTNTRRDALFSSYLDGAEKESFVLKLGNKSTPNDHHVFLEKKSDDVDDDIELDVFGAEKYFNEAADHIIPPNHQLVPPTHHHPRLPKKDEFALEIFAIKPQQSTRSESSCNSRSSLLQPVTTRNPRQQQQQQQQPSTKTNRQILGFLARIGCKCSCAGKSSVDVVDEENKTGRRGGGPEKKRLAKMMTTWDADVSPPEEMRTIPSVCGGEESDGSDASSDLFEIESLSRGCKSPAAAACYAPSEASVEWSVVTASAADLEEPVGSGPKRAGPHREVPRLRAGMLSGCMSQKAVRVAGGGSGRNLRTESFTPARFHHEGMIKFNKQRSGENAARLLHA